MVMFEIPLPLTLILQNVQSSLFHRWRRVREEKETECRPTEERLALGRTQVTGSQKKPKEEPAVRLQCKSVNTL